jgi:hypothetical protein
VRELRLRQLRVRQLRVCLEPLEGLALQRARVGHTKVYPDNFVPRMEEPHMLSTTGIGAPILIGVAATAIMDVWLLVLSRLGLATTDWRLVGRWVGQMPKGRFAHASIAHAPPVRGEHALGWLTHYAVGIAYAGALVAFVGAGWARQPTLLPALLFGLVTVVVPLFVMQPAMGSGFAASKTPSPLKTFLRSVANHGAFGGGLYLAAAGIAYL